MRPSLVVSAVAIVLVIGCDDATSPGGPPVASTGFLNATSGKIDVAVDGQTVLAGIDGSVIAPLNEADLSPGQHQVRVRATGGTTGGAVFTLAVTAGGKRNFVAYQAPGAALSAAVLEDTGAFVPAGKSKVRVLNLAPNSDIDIWRTQPDYQTPVTFQFPFPFNPEPGPYLQSDAGVWQIWITPTSNSASKLHETGPLDIPSGEKRTIVVVDSAGKLRLRVLID
jgi:hypothetical protein